MKLNKRLQNVALVLEKGAGFADIGTDHGKLPVYALINRIADNVIATDISKQSLQKACNLANKYGVYVDLREGDGLAPLKAFEVDCVVIAGMGGHEIVRIIKDRINEFARYIFLPHKNTHVLRSFLKEKNIGIEVDRVICEGKFFYHMLTCNINLKWDSDNIYIGKDNDLENYDFVKYLKYKINALDKLIEKSKGSNLNLIEEKKELYKWIK